LVKKIAIGILAYNEESHIESVINEILTLKKDVYVLNDSSTDETMNILERMNISKKFTIINNLKNEGAGNSTLKLIETIKNDGFEFVIKVDGDNQFKLEDVNKIIKLHEDNEYDFIKSNRFWEKGIEGKIPRSRYFGNLFATIMLQFISGTNKLFDPLNGLFGINVKVLNYINKKVYPKRYGYPFYFSGLSAISFFKVFQINNVVTYGSEKSNLSSIRMFFTLIRLTIHFLILKIKNKMLIGKYQRSAFLDSVFLFFLILNFIIFLRFVLIFTSIQIFNSSFIGSWALILLLISFFTVFLFIESFKEEKAIRSDYINNEE
tara:strand:- start:2218 stop:3177 length:960 start_codon:yes stop_codon:yes gene_type:complete